jgi:hypothetical protein
MAEKTGRCGRAESRRVEDAEHGSGEKEKWDSRKTAAVIVVILELELYVAVR